MKLESVLLAFICFSNWTFQHVIADPMSSEEHSNVEDAHLKTQDVLDMNTRSRRDAPDMQMETNWNVPVVTKDTYEDADWHPSTSVLEAHFDQTPDSPEVTHNNNIGTDNHGPSQTLNQTIGASATQCGEYSSQLTPNGRCRLMAKLPPVGTTEKRCPDMFRCTDDISFWLHENQNRKEQLKELRETVSELQEELRNHRHRVKALELQVEDNVRINSTLKERLQFLELRYIETDTLLQVHGALLYELQAQLRNLSASVQHMTQNTGCTINVIRAPPPLSMRDALPPGGHHASYCPSDCASLYHSGVRRSGVYTIVMSPTITFPVYCDMETDGGGWTIFQRRRDGSVSFNQGWSEYRNGFGEPDGEHWLGNQHLYLLSSQDHYSLRIDMQDWSHAHKHALYRSFRIDGEENQYRLHVSGFRGSLEDSFGWYHDQHGFSTPDTGNICAEISHSGWWFHQCFYTNLNGVYYKGGRYSLKANNLLGPDGIVWFSWKDSDFYSLKTVTMMIRPRSFRPPSSLRLSP
ncbi:angiopoietin-related protein 7-like [Nematolebias whitei]|uniref:angiopoietin-related protein 7-like n=1 Tax=Nematolebias whitei TaxID=451745 RepID=UPI00189A7BBB|nr:angiopoietin-related protein 7-like [Nematolebias whitei]